MPLRDHFRTDPRRHPNWEGFAHMLAVGCVVQLNKTLPEECLAEPRIGGDFRDEDDFLTTETAFAAAETVGDIPPTQSVVWPDWARRSFQTLIFSNRFSRRLAAVLEIVCPIHKSDAATRQASLIRCAAYLQANTSVALLDIVTNEPQNLFVELFQFLGLPAPVVAGQPEDLYAVVLRPRFFQDGGGKRLEVTAAKLTLGQPLPILPFALEWDIDAQLNLEPVYEESCYYLNVPKD